MSRLANEIRHPLFAANPGIGWVPVQGKDPKWRYVQERVARLAYAEYERQYGSQQSFVRLHERGGFGMAELIELLANSLVRLGAEPAAAATKEGNTDD